MNEMKGEAMHTCPQCETNTVSLQPALMNLKRKISREALDAALLAVRALSLPTCSRCGEQFIGREEAKKLDREMPSPWSGMYLHGDFCRCVRCETLKVNGYAVTGR